MSRDMRKNAKLATLLFMLLCLVWSLVIPIGESHDEYNHVRYAQFIWKNHRLPNAHEIWTGQVTEGFQPPLYHTLIAGLIGLLQFSIDDISWVGNPKFSTVSTGEPNIFDNKTVRERSPADEILKFHLLRLPSIVIAGLTFWWLWLGLSRLFVNETLALIAVSIWAFMVQTTHLGGAIGNDMLTACFSALVFVWLVGVDSAPSIRRYVLIGVLLGLALMTKMTSLFVYGGVCLSLFLNGMWKRRPVAFGTVVLLPLLIGGWAVLRSMQVHMPSVESAWIISLSDGIVPYAKSWLIAILHAIQSGILSFIGSPGWGWLPMPSWYYGIYLAFFLLVIGAVGTRFRVFTRSFPYESAAYLVGLIVFVCMTVYWFRESPERMAGRYLYPFMAGPLGIMCWAFRNVSGNIRVGTRVSVSLFGIGLVLLMIGWFGTGFANILGRLLQSSGPFLMRSDHYSTLMATDLAILGMTLIFLSIGFANIGRLWSRIEQAYGPVIIGSATANMLLLAFWIKPLYS